MQKLLLILSFTFGLVSPVFALKAGETHADPYKVMTEGILLVRKSWAIELAITLASYLHIRVTGTVVLLLCHCQRLKEL